MIEKTGIQHKKTKMVEKLKINFSKKSRAEGRQVIGLVLITTNTSVIKKAFGV